MIKKFTSLKSIFAFALLIFAMNINAQVIDALRLTDKAIADNAAQWNLTAQDIADFHISSSYTSDHNGVMHVYANQVYKNMMIENAIINLTFSKEGELAYGNSRFVSDLTQKINAETASLSAEEALAKAFQILEISAELPKRLEEKDFSKVVFAKEEVANLPINVQLMYRQVDDQLQLNWRVQIYASKSFAIYIDANNGEMNAKQSLDVECSFHKGMYHNHAQDCAHDHEASPAIAAANALTLNATYHVFALPLESPNHGERTIEENPADPQASPFGWHDVDGQDGAEYTNTRGNNVHAFYDPEADEVPPATEVDGGQDLVFDFDYFSDQEPTAQVNNTVTQLFYMNNMMHDISYAFGFTEEAGNFQQNNYGNGGTGGDYVVAFSQYGNGGDGTVNNATFATPEDGGSGAMRMFLWNSGSGIFEITSPSQISGYYSVGTGQYGPDVNTAPATGEVVIVQDETGESSTDGCEAIVNADEVNGKIAMIDRGSCFFEQKTVNAEAAGAIAVIICNFEDATLNMAGTDLPDPGIVSVSLSSSDCNLIKAALDGGPVVVKLEQPQGGVDFVSGSYDNGVMAHEYAHGISNRLTGGRLTTSCLFNEEQMGEGWSDFFSLVTTVEDGDTGADKRGIGTYATSEPVEGNGIRPYPYSTDMTINPMVYDDITTFSVPHGVGAVWCSMLWDLYWAMVDEHGYDANVYNTEAGNNMAIQLVMDGMALQPCLPGFVDGRDAILAADELLYGGANQCLIWDVFARRGLGINASQGSADSRSDGTPNYESVPTCIAELKIKKDVTPTIVAGENVDVTLTITNHRPETLTNVIVTDELPDGLTFDENSSSIPGTVSGNILTFELGDMVYEDEIVITYALKSDPANFSPQFYYDGMELESTLDFWAITTEPFTEAGWSLSENESYEGQRSFFVADNTAEMKTELINLFPILIQGDNPTLRFAHNIQTPTGINGGYIEISIDGGNTWERVPDTFIRNGYNGGLSYQTFTIPFLQGFSGNSNGYIFSYLDLSAYVGETILYRFKFGTAAGSTPQYGWSIDNIEIMDLLSYNSEACVTADQGDTACATGANVGTIVDSSDPTSTNDLDYSLDFKVFPNPASDVINIQLSDLEAGKINIQLFDTNGRMIKNIEKQSFGNIMTSIPTAELANGVYMVKVISNGFAGTQKVILN